MPYVPSLNTFFIRANPFDNLMNQPDYINPPMRGGNTRRRRSPQEKAHARQVRRLAKLARRANRS